MNFVRSNSFVQQQSPMHNASTYGPSSMPVNVRRTWNTPVFTICRFSLAEMLAEVVESHGMAREEMFRQWGIRE